MKDVLFFSFALLRSSFLLEKKLYYILFRLMLHVAGSANWELFDAESSWSVGRVHN